MKEDVIMSKSIYLRDTKKIQAPASRAPTQIIKYKFSHLRIPIKEENKSLTTRI